MAIDQATESIELSGGYNLDVNVGGSDVVFSAKHDSHRDLDVCVELPFKPRRSWQREWDPAHDEPEYARVEYAGTYGSRYMTPTASRVLAEVLQLAADFCERLNEQNAEALAHQEHQRREHRLRQQREREAEEAKRAEIKEQVQWYIGQKFKLRRRGYRATVFGTIDAITDTQLRTTSERGVPMTTQIEDLTELHIMYEGERRYTKVFPA